MFVGVLRDIGRGGELVQAAGDGGGGDGGGGGGGWKVALWEFGVGGNLGRWDWVL